MPANISPPPSKARLIVDRIGSSRIDGFSLVIAETRPIRSRVGWLYVRIALRDQAGAISSTPIATGIVSGGGREVKPWIECRLFPRVEFGDRTSIDARGLGLEAEIVRLMGEWIPPGGHLMLDYENPGQEDTFAELVLGIPPPASYLGFLMFRAGCRSEFKDWYFSEGGHEGPRKLQANKSPDAAAEKLALRGHMKHLRAFIRSPMPRGRNEAAIVAGAKARARLLLKEFGRKIG